MISALGWRFGIVFFPLVLLYCLINACASSEIVKRDYFKDESSLSLHWPPPPQKPRILYLGYIKDPTDRGSGGSFLQRTLDSIFGEEKISSIMLRPYGVFADNGMVFVTDPGSGRIHVFDRTGKQYFGIEKAGDVALISPIGIAVDGNRNMYVSDSMLKQVFVFDQAGKYLRTIGPPDMFQRPSGIALVDDRMYIVDTHRHRVVVLSQTDGSLLFSFGKQGAVQGDFNYPTNIFVSRDKLIYVTDSMNFRVQVFNPDGSFVTSFGRLGDGSGNFSKPKGIAVDSEGHIYVVDAHFDNVQIFDQQGNLLLVFGGSGNSSGEFILPAGIYIDSSDRIYVSDSYNKRIQIFQYVKEQKEEVAK